MNITSSPYSAQGATISRLLSVGYLSGKSATNPEQLLADKALPDFSGMKLNTDHCVFSLSQTGDTAPSGKATLSDDIPLQMYTLTQTGTVDTIQPHYTLHGATFSGDEIRTSKEFLEGMTTIMRENGVFSTALDYDDYAIMGLGESQLRAFGQEQGFTDAQVNALIVDYRDSIGALVKKNLAEFPFHRQVTNSPASQYFFLHRAEAGSIGDYPVKEGTLVSTPDMAVNWSMVRAIYEGMATVNQNSDSSLKNAVAQFEQEATTARKTQTPVPSWVSYRVGIYMENIAKFETAVDSFRSARNAKHPHLDTKA